MRGLVRYLNRVRLGQKPLYLEYHYDFQRRWEPSGHRLLASQIEESKDTFERNLKEISDYERIVKRFNQPGELSMKFDNGFMPVLDGLSVMWAARRSAHTYMEIGSGFSTVYARAGLKDSGSGATIVSIDPQPRAEIDKLCDEVIRSPLEDMGPTIFDRLKPGDTLFLDGSHRSFTNSDVTVFFLDILPQLPSGVLVGIHDICLPFDYPEAWRERGYNEQYMLAAWMLANPDYFDLQLCNFWVCQKGMHKEPLQKIWDIVGEKAKLRAASAFWAVKR
ncbi:class I SAM-dependent methyltransferase [Rhizobium bangladeshense]|uniref:class I SAM-dependent methyltransferase n=1 Tax=Rhizobium bangladeshense TaxID=1138189 RepID=UPI001C83A272|nr:class I SAM-dependent methyltransferase [Rhizobium bangladeshense]MBX4921008.1 class I SAM-dependent methyltransferase [Rhizobium bangladeshense]